MADDLLAYRLAIIDVFHQWGLYPRDVSTPVAGEPDVALSDAAVIFL